MKTFKDKNGDQWSLDFNLATVLDIEENIDFSEVTDIKISFRKYNENTVNEILSNPFVAVPIAWMTVQEQAEKRGVKSDKDFYRLLDEKAVSEVQVAIVEELANFFPFQRTTILKLIDHFSRLKTIAHDELMNNKDLQLSDEDMRKMIRNEFKRRTASIGDLSSV